MASGDLTGLETVKAYLKIQDADTTTDELLGTLISAASDFIQGVLNRTFAAADYVQRYNGNGVALMVAADYPILSVASVTLNGIPISPALDDISAGYVFDADAIYLRGFLFPKGIQNVVLSYRAGFVSIPLAVADACAMLVAKKYKYLDRIGHLSKVLAGETISYEKSDLTDEIKSILRNYAKVVPV